MWRNTVGFSSKLLAASKSSSSLRLLLLHHGIITRSTFTAASSGPESTEAAGLVKLGFSSGSPGSSAVDLSSFAAATLFLKSMDVVDFAKHYGRCYWELSKALLREQFTFCITGFLVSHLVYCMSKGTAAQHSLSDVLQLPYYA